MNHSLLIPYRKGDKWGFSDKNKNIIIECKYDFIPWRYRWFEYGFEIVGKNGKEGCINYLGTEIIPCIYEWIMPLLQAEGIWIKKNDKYGFVNRNGKEILPCIFDFWSDFHDGLTWLQKKNFYGCFDINGNEIVPFIYETDNSTHWTYGGNKITYSPSFIKGLAKVKRDGKWGYINKAGKEIIPCEYDAIYEFDEYFDLIKKKEKYGLINREGKIIIPLKYEQIIKFAENIFNVAKGNGFFDEKFGLIDNNGKIIIPCEYDIVKSITDKLIEVRAEKKYGLFDKNGKEILSCRYDEISLDKDLIKLKYNDQYGIIDQIGNWIIPLEYDFINFSEEVIIVNKNDKYGLFARDGKKITQCIYELYENLAMVEKNGFIDKSAHEIIQCKYDPVANFENGYSIVKKNGKSGVINNLGQILIPIEYDSIADSNKEFFYIENDGKYGFIAKDLTTTIPCLYEIEYSGIEGIKDNPKFINGFLCVKKEGKYGYIDFNGSQYWED